MAVTTTYDLTTIVPEWTVRFATFYGANGLNSANERNPALVRLADGGFGVGYEIDILPSHNHRMLLDVYNADGTHRPTNGALGTVNLDTFVPGLTMQDAEITRLSNNNLLAVWKAPDGIHYAIVNAANGALLTPDTLLDGTIAAHQAPDVVALPGGGFVVAIQENVSGTNQNAYIQFFDASGTRLGFTALGGGSSSDERDPAIAVLANGNVVVAYEQEETDGSGTFDMAYRLFTSAGAAVGGEVIFDTAGSQNIQPDVLALSGGGFVVAYSDDGWGEPGLTLAFFNSDGSFRNFVRADEFSSLDSNPSLTQLSNGLVSVSWTYQSGDIATALFDPVTITRLSQNGIVLIENQTGIQERPAHLALDNGQIVTAWTDNNNALEDGNTDPGGQHVALQIDAWQRNSVGDGASDTINGDDLIDNMYGNGGSDTLNGGGGDDMLSGGVGNDTLNGGANGAGGDTAHFGDAFGAVVVTLDATGGALVTALGIDTDTLIGIENLAGGEFGDTLTGNASANRLQGHGSTDTLIGGGGSDAMIGGSGSDVYYVENVGDVVTETDADVAIGGFDTVYSTVSFTLGANVEQLSLYGGMAGLTATGNAQANVLYGNLHIGGVTLLGLGGDDVFYGSNYADTIDGGANNDVLQAFYSVDGVDTLIGGAGDDVYYTFETGDIITELGGGGFDTVYAQANITLGDNVEQLIVYGATTSATGNASNNNMFGNNSSVGLSLSGLGGDDWLIGSNLDDTLNGGANNDQLQGLGGTNTLIGGASSDVYYSTSATDIITEAAGVPEGFDTLYANYNIASLSANVEQAIVYGGATIVTGNASDNGLYGNNNTVAMTLDGAGGNDTIYGTALGDTLIGGLGNDTLVGLGGTDTYRYNASGNMGGDTIIGFADGTERIDLAGRGYSAASIGSTITIAGGANAVITFASGSLAGTTIALNAINQANVTSADFLF